MSAASASSSETKSHCESFSGLTEQEKLETFLDPGFGRSTNEVALRCSEDAMYNAYMHYAPEWGQVVKDHISFHEISSLTFNAGEGEMVYVYSSVEVLKAKLAEKDAE
eukprot:1029956-Amphidinium_carterae.1